VKTRVGSSVILFDGFCNLCSALVLFVIAHDPEGRFRFASLQSPAAARLLGERSHPGPSLDTVVLVEGDRVYSRSSAALRIAKELRFPWPLLFMFVVVPRPLRDWAYGFVARHRYRWFGQRDACMAPAPELRARFLSD
jgi:predicted DCC family thiol-disulfide oxidoreductase YuxK